jgi:cytoskeletal protein RodZ
MKQETNKEMDLLLRRLSARGAGSESRADGEHLDADELSSYAENALPASARARYTEHLAECASCRKLIAQLSSSVGFVNEEVSRIPQPSALRKFLASLFSPMVLRYAVPALGLIIVAAIGFTVLRREQPKGGSNSVAQLKEQDGGRAATFSEQTASPSSGQVASLPDQNKSSAPTSKPAGSKANETPAPPPNAPPSVTVNSEVKQDAPKPEQQPAAKEPAPPAATPTAQPTAAPAAAVTEVKKVEDERQAQQDRISPGSVATAAAPANSRGLGGRPLEMAKLKRRDAADKDKNEAAAETRSVGGRRFRKENGVWIDTAYDSSSATVNLTRGSEQYRALVADEPTIKIIAEQLDGEIIVVWKGRTYRIH